AKAKMSAELQQERQLAQSMEKESEARKAEADKLAKALGGGAAAKAMVPRQTAGMTLTAALQNSNCLDKIAAQSPNPAVPQALFIGGTLPTKGGNSACTSVTISTTDTTPFSAASPLIPVVVGSGGTLTLVDPGAGSRLTLYASSLLIKNSGTMQAGTASNPVQGQITIAMAGNQSAALAPSATGGASIVTTSNNAPNARDITVMDGGTLALYGAKGLSATPGTLNKDIVSGTKSWTYLAVPAGPAKYNDAENVSAPVPATNPDTTLTLATQVDWQINNWVSVATTSFSSHQTEIVQICGISSVANPDPQASTLGLPANVSQVTLCSTTPLKHYHYGGLTPTPGFFPAGTKQVVAKGGNAIDVGRQAKSFYDDHTRNYGIDERAEVALLSRNIKLTSVAGSAGDQQLFQNTATYPLSYDMGGHVVAMVTGTTYPTLQLVGVEIEKFGQGLTGRYPVHLHMLQNL
ncbi:MAG: G8 domain-containing protein, partial [Nitrospirota bacterium]|nr:G8 domain-containing protein [Nitrospirota bacterium]